MFIDSHCHLNYDVYDADRQCMMQRAVDAGVQAMLAIGVCLDKLEEVVTLAENDERIFASVGIHPNEVAGTEQGTDYHRRLETWLSHPRVVGIGESGLDYYYEHSPRQQQQDFFRTHIALSQEWQLPLIVHTRTADEDTVRLLQEGYAQKPFPFLIHCFTASMALAQACLDIGGYISVSGIITFKNAADLRASIEKIPLNRLLIETDAPYLAPVPHRSKRNEPAYVALVAQKLAEIKNVPVEDIAAQTTQNFLTLFNKAKL